MWWAERDRLTPLFKCLTSTTLDVEDDKVAESKESSSVFIMDGAIFELATLVDESLDVVWVKSSIKSSPLNSNALAIADGECPPFTSLLLQIKEFNKEFILLIFLIYFRFSFKSICWSIIILKVFLKVFFFFKFLSFFKVFFWIF